MTNHGGTIRYWAYVSATLWAGRYLMIPLLFPCVMSSEANIMVSTIPTDFVLSDAITCAVVALIVCIFTFLWRYVEHNDAESLTRETNPMKLKFIGGTVLAIVVTGLLAYLASAVLVGYFKIVEPCAVDFALFGALSALAFGIAFTIIFNEGITALGKFIAQKVRETKDAVDGLPPEIQAILADYARIKKVEAEADEVPKE